MGLNVVSDMIEVFSSTIMIYSIFRFLLYFETKEIKKYMQVLIGVEILLLCMHYLKVNSIAILLYVLGVPVCLNYLFVLDKKCSKLIYAFFSILLIGGMENITLKILTILLNLLNWNMSEYIKNIIIMLGVTLVWIFISRFVDNRYVNRSRRMQTHFFIFISIACCLNHVIYDIATECVYETDFGSYQNKTAIEWSLLFFGVVILIEIIYIIFLYFEKTHYTIENDFTREYLEIEKKHFKELQNRDKNIRKYRHDMKYHLAVLSNLVSEKKYDKLETYLQQLDDTFVVTQFIYQTGNEIVDGILNQKKKILEDNHIELQLEGDLKKIDYIDDFDLCTVFANALQNAVEACMKMPEGTEKRRIIIQFITIGTELRVRIENTVKETLVIKNGQIKTNKEDKLNHGFGLSQISKVVKDYNGSVDIESQDNKFIIKLLFKKK